MEYLPNTLSVFFCTQNLIRILPELPYGITELNCEGCDLEYLPYLPETLIRLYFSCNKITEIPNIPKHLREICCDDNNIIDIEKYDLSHIGYISIANQSPKIMTLPLVII